MNDRRIISCRAAFEPYTAIAETELLGSFGRFPNSYILIHSDEGVIWGRTDAMGHPEARSATVEVLEATELWQQIRLFADDFEIHLWRDGAGLWQGRRLYDLDSDEDAVFLLSLDENHLLWGNQAKDVGGGFTQLFDASQGLAHIVPLPFDQVNAHVSQRDHYVALKVRHYFEELPGNGALRIAASRLVSFAFVSQRNAFNGDAP